MPESLDERSQRYPRDPLRGWVSLASLIERFGHLWHLFRKVCSEGARGGSIAEKL